MIDNNIKMLTDREHCLKRPAMYIGSVSNEPHERFLFGEYKTLTYVPGLVKIIDEIIDNSIDEAIRTKFEFANEIEVEIKDSKITVKDNGRGIPQANVITPEGESIPGPVAAWTRTKAGGNFGNDLERVTGGQNGVGSSLTNFFSTWFEGVTGDGKNIITVTCNDNAENINFSVKKGKLKGTSVSFVPDFDRFDCTGIDKTIQDIIQDRLMTLSIIFDKITFKFNGKKIQGNFKKFASQFGEKVITMENDNVSVAFANSPDGFRHLSFVNQIHTKVGGSHIDWLMDEISNELIPSIKRKYRIEVTKARIKECLTVLVFIRNMSNMKFDGQTKERLTNTWGEVKNHMDIDVKKLANQLMKTETILMPIIEAVLARKLAAEQAAATKAAKKAAKAKVAKHIKANFYGKPGKGTTLFLTEGDSALNELLTSRIQDTQGGYPLRGKFLNTWGMKDVDIMKSKEAFDIMAITGLTLGESPFEYAKDGQWFKTIIDGEEVIVNENDEILIKGTWVKVSELL
ncbi:DNA topoisomerase [Proteus phage PM2]|uniref:DNA topoisomerase (ATP-hydrolyzing) n=1 Tax=Proteus phage PM2 TaxID=2025809 RepID=A0A249XX16_9CAUD|nr:DNA topoisomerase II large subunit [Proteus phage PM2]ASZ76528.1 DNA topoisomerase [Proteus phage PM2]